MSKFKNFTNKLVHLLDNKKFVIVLSVLIAIFLWAFVALKVNTDGYKIVKNVPIQFTTNSETGFSVISQDIKAIDIVLHGNRSVIGVLSADDFSVTANYSNVTEAGSYTLNIGVSAKNPSSNYSISSYSNKTVSVLLDKVISKTFEIQTELVKASVADGYVLQKPSLTKTETIVTGPESEVSAIASAWAKVNVNAELTETKTKTVDIEYRNADGAKITPKYVNADIDEVEVTISVLKEKEVKVKFTYNNFPKGLSENALKYSLSQSTIKIAGPEKSVEDMTEVNIGYVDIADLKLDGKIDLPVTLPAGFMNLEEVPSVTISFDFSNYIQKVFSTSQIKVVNVPSDYEITVLTKNISNINVIGENITSLSSADIIAELDVSTLGELTPGSQSVPIKIVITGGKTAWAIGDYTVNVSVKAK